MNQDSNQAVYFQCQLCGECCSSWNILIEAEKAEALLQKDWVQQRLQQTGRSLQPQSEAMYRIPLTDENVCVFLGEDRRCLVEVNEGLALKPHECQRFPFATVKAPDGTTIHDTSAACKSVSEKLLLAFQPIQPKPKTLEVMNPETESPQNNASEPWLEDAQTLPRQVRLSLFRQLDWEILQALRADWKYWFQSDTYSAEEALSLIGASLRAEYPNLLQTASQTSPIRLPWGWTWRQQALVLYFLRKPYQSFSLFQILSGSDYHDPRVFGEPLPLPKMRQVRWSTEGEAPLKAFVYNLLNRNRLLATGGSVQSLVAMAGVAVGLVRWYAKALAVLQHAEATTSSDVATAIRLVERYYTGHQPRFFHFFQSRFRGWIVLRLLGWF